MSFKKYFLLTDVDEQNSMNNSFEMESTTLSSNQSMDTTTDSSSHADDSHESSEESSDFEAIVDEDVAIYFNQEEQPEIQELREWAVKNKIYLTHVDQLLLILRRRLIPDLPKCSKTFLGTNRAEYNIIPMKDKAGPMGQFVYLGLKKGLLNCVNTQLHPNNHIELQFNCDGVPLVKSGNQTFWPILCKVHSIPDVYEPFALAIYFGESKPEDVNLYTEQFIEEVNEVIETGLDIEEDHFEVSIKCFVCDTPARAFLKCTVGHKSKYACERCTVDGGSLEGRTIYESVDAAERTNASFRNQTQPLHHKGVSPLLRIMPSLNMIFIFVLDSMHLLYQGIIKKLLDYWFEKCK